MTYHSIYEAVRDTYHAPGAWDRMIQAGEPESCNLAEEALGRHAGSDAVALRIRDFETGDEETATFDELDRAANRAATFFTETMDRREIMGLLLPPRVELYASLFGSIKSHRPFVPLDTKFGPDAIGYRLRDAEATTLVTTAGHLPDVAEADVPTLERVVVVDDPDGHSLPDADVVPYDAIAESDPSYDAIGRSPEEAYAIVYSSGTTGQPHPGLSPQATMVGIEPYLKFVVDLQASDTYFAAASPAWSYGLTVGTLCPGLVGANIGAYRGPFDLERWVETLDRWDVTNAMIAPTALRQLRASDVPVADYDVDLRVLVTAGESLDAESATWVRDHLGTTPLDAYGLSEGGMLLCNYPFPDWEVKAGSMGKPLPSYDVRLIDPGTTVTATSEEPAEADELPFVDERGEVGEIAVYQTGGSGPLEGLQPEGWQRTGDLAEIDDDGYWWYRGRRDAVIISAGYRIGPEEVQETLLSHDAVAEAGVVGVPDETRGEVVAAAVTLAAGYDPSEDLREAIVEYSREQLSAHEYPRRLAFVDELPKTASDKIKRSDLQEIFEQDEAASSR
jgi:acetyl-CoA synthetase